VITADNITDEQIRELKRSLDTPGDTQSDHPPCRSVLPLALGQYGSDFQRRRARARCAEILNARQEGK